MTVSNRARKTADNGSNSSDLRTILEKLAEIAVEIGKDAARRERERELPHGAFQLLRTARFGALRLPVALGGPGASVRELMEAVSSLAVGDSNVAHALRSHFNFVEVLLLSAPEQRPSYVTSLLKGMIFGAAHTEVGTARPGEIRTQLVARDGGYRLNGRKYYATGAIFADRLFITARHENGGSAIVAVEPTRKGVVIRDDWDGMGQRLTSSGSILLEDVAIAPDEIEWRDAVEREDYIGRHTATFRQLYLAACQAGIVRNLLSEAVKFVSTKARPITHGHADKATDDMFVQRTIGLMASQSFAIDALIASAADKIDAAYEAVYTDDGEAGRLLTESALATAKAQCIISELAQSAATKIFDTGGGSATSRSLNFDRHWRNIRTILGHNPVDYKLKVVGDNLLNGTPPPLSGGFF